MVDWREHDRCPVKLLFDQNLSPALPGRLVKTLTMARMNCATIVGELWSNPA